MPSERSSGDRRHPRLSLRYLAVLATAAVAILVVGIALRPRSSKRPDAPPPSQSEVRRLQRLAERQALDETAEHLATVAAEASARVLSLGTDSSGVAWAGDLVVGAGTAGPAPLSTLLTAPSGAALPARRVVGGPGLPLRAFEVAEALDPVVLRRKELTAGEWLLAVWRGQAGTAFAPCHYAETRQVPCGDLTVREVVTNLAPQAAPAGAALFDLDRALVALVLPCQGRLVALSTESVGLALTLGRTPEQRLRDLWGLRVRTVASTATSRLAVSEGALVDEVWSGFPADLAGLRPGDVIIGADERPVRSPDDLRSALLVSGAQEEPLSLWRGRLRLELRLSLTATPSRPTRPALRFDGAGEGYRIAAVAPGSPAAAAGIEPGDRVLRVDFAVPRSAADVERALARPSGRPLFFEIAGSRRRFGLFLP